MVVLHPIFLVPLVLSAVIGRRRAIPFIAVGSALAQYSEGWLGWTLYLSAIAALTGLPLRWGIAELIDEIVPPRHNLSP